MKGNFGRHGRFRFHIHAPAETQATPASPKLPISGAMEQAREARVSRTPTTTHTGAAQVSTRAPTETQTTPASHPARPHETQTTPASPKLPVSGAMKQAREAQVSHTPTTTHTREAQVSHTRPPLKPKPPPLHDTRRLKGNFRRQGRLQFHTRPPLKPKPPLLRRARAPAETQTTPASHPHAHVKPKPPPLQGTRRLKGNFGRHGRFRFHIHAPAETQATPASPKLPISGAMEQAREARVSHTPTTTHTGAAQVSHTRPRETQTTPAARYTPLEGQFRKARALPVSPTWMTSASLASTSPLRQPAHRRGM